MKLINKEANVHKLDISITELEEMSKLENLILSIKISEPILKDYKMRLLLVRLVDKLINEGIVKKDMTPLVVEFNYDKLYKFFISKIEDSTDELNGWMFDYISDF